MFANDLRESVPVDVCGSTHFVLFKSPEKEKAKIIIAKNQYSFNSVRSVTFIRVIDLGHIGSGNGSRLIGAKLLPKPMLIHCRVNH